MPFEPQDTDKPLRMQISHALFGSLGVRMTKEEMENRLKKAYPDGQIEVFDLTGTQDHWEVSVTSSQFQGMSRVQQHQHVMGQFSAELASGEVHALSIRTK